MNLITKETSESIECGREQLDLPDDLKIGVEHLDHKKGFAWTCYRADLMFFGYLNFAFLYITMLGHHCI